MLPSRTTLTQANAVIFPPWRCRCTLPVRGESPMDQNAPRQASPVIPQTSTTTTTVPTSGSNSILGDLLRTLGVKQGHADEVHQQASGADVNKQIDQAHQY